MYDRKRIGPGQIMLDKEDGTEEMIRNRKDRLVELTVQKKRTERDNKR